jgi:hypothetical protein
MAALLPVTALVCARAETNLPVLKPETLCVPVISSRALQNGVAPNNRGGWSFVAQFMNYYSTGNKEKLTNSLPNGGHYLSYKNLSERPEAEWIIADLQAGSYKLLRWPGFHAAEVGSVLAGNGRLFFTVDYGHIYYYEPAEDTVKPLGRVWDNLDELRMFYKFILGPDGMVYGSAQATSGRTMLIQLNPDTLTYKLFHKVGLKGRRPGLTYGYYLAVDPPWMYTAVGQGNWELFAVNAETGEQKCLVDVTGEGSRITCELADGFIRAGVGRPGSPPERFWLVDGAAVPADPSGKKPDALPISEKTYKAVEWKNTKPANLAGKPKVDSAKGVITIDREGRGEIVWRPADSTNVVNSLPFAISNAEPVTIESLTAMPDGTLLGNARGYSGFFRFDPASRKLDFFGKFSPSGPAVAQLGGKFYLCGYPNTMIIEYDPDKPWTATAASEGKGTNDNPRHRGTLGQGTSESHFCRKLINGGNGRLYSLGLRERWSTGTGLGYYEPATGKRFGLGQANKDIEPQGMVVLPDLKRLVFSGDPIGKGDARLIVYDLDLNEVEKLEIRPGLDSGGALFESAATNEFLGCCHGLTTNTFTFYRYDLAEKKVVRQVELPARIQAILTSPADGAKWALASDTLYRLDPVTLAMTPVGSIPKGVDYPVLIGKFLYGTRGGELIRVALP